MTEEEKVVVVIPAFNERWKIGRAINVVKRSGLNAEIIVVNDGSTDGTSAVAKKKGCHVIDFPKNRGKTAAVFAGFREALKRNPTAVITLDADLIHAPKAGLRELARQATEATRKRQIKMVVAHFRELWHNEYSTARSGTRAYSTPALHKLQQSKVKAASVGFGLEKFLNRFFKEHTSEIEHVFNYWPPRGSKKGRPWQAGEISQTHEKMRRGRFGRLFAHAK